MRQAFVRAAMAALLGLGLPGLAFASCYSDKKCGGRGQQACTVIQCLPSCQGDLKEFWGTCAKTCYEARDCGREGEKACTVEKCLPSCAGSKLKEHEGRCVADCRSSARAVDEKPKRDTLYKYEVTSCVSGDKETYSIPVGVGLVSADTLKRGADGCSIPPEVLQAKLIDEDLAKRAFRAACNVHDVMYSIRAPSGGSPTADRFVPNLAWKDIVDKAFLLNLAATCRRIFPVASLPLLHCFETAKIMYKAVALGGAAAYRGNQQWAEQNRAQAITAAQMQRIKAYLDQNDLPASGTDWSPAKGGVLNPK